MSSLSQNAPFQQESMSTGADPEVNMEFADYKAFQSWLASPNTYPKWTQTISYDISENNNREEPIWRISRYMCEFGGYPANHPRRTAQEKARALLNCGCPATLEARQKSDKDKVLVFFFSEHKGHALTQQSGNIGGSVCWTAVQSIGPSFCTTSSQAAHFATLPALPHDGSILNVEDFRRHHGKNMVLPDSDCWKKFENDRYEVLQNGGLSILNKLSTDETGFDGVFIYAFCTKIQIDALHHCLPKSDILIDSVPEVILDLADEDRTVTLYILILYSAESKLDLPVGYMITNSETQRPLTEWLFWIKFQLIQELRPNFIIDSSRMEMAAIRAVFTDHQIGLAYWRMSRVIRAQSKHKIRSMDRRDLQESAWSDFQILLHTRTKAELENAWREYREKYASEIKWLEYLGKMWIARFDEWWNGHHTSSVIIRTENEARPLHYSLKSQYIGYSSKKRLRYLVDTLINEVNDHIFEKHTMISRRCGSKKAQN